MFNGFHYTYDWLQLTFDQTSKRKNKSFWLSNADEWEPKHNYFLSSRFSSTINNDGWRFSIGVSLVTVVTEKQAEKTHVGAIGLKFCIIIYTIA